MRIDGLAVLLERQIVEARAFEIDAALEPRRVDRDVRRGGDDAFAGLRAGRGGRVRQRRCAGLGRAGLRRAGLRRRDRLRRVARLRRARLQLALLLLLEQRVAALLFHLRIADEILPADDDDERQHDGEDGVSVLGHSELF